MLNLIKVAVNSSCAYGGGGEGSRNLTACKFGKSQQYEMTARNQCNYRLCSQKSCMRTSLFTSPGRPRLRDAQSQRESPAGPRVTAWDRSETPLRRRAARMLGPALGRGGPGPRAQVLYAATGGAQTRGREQAETSQSACNRSSRPWQLLKREPICRNYLSWGWPGSPQRTSGRDAVSPHSYGAPNLYQGTAGFLLPNRLWLPR